MKLLSAIKRRLKKRKERARMLNEIKKEVTQIATTQRAYLEFLARIVAKGGRPFGFETPVESKKEKIFDS